LAIGFSIGSTLTVLIALPMFTPFLLPSWSNSEPVPEAGEHASPAAGGQRRFTAETRGAANL
jgi:hypothetical protein